MNRKQAGIGLGVGVAAFVGLIALSGQYVPPTNNIPALTSGGGLTITGGKVGLTTSCSTGEQLEWNGSAWQCRPREPAWQTGKYYFAPFGVAGTSSSTANNQMRASPFYVPNSISITKIGAEVTGAGNAGSLVRLGIYRNDDTGVPGTLVVDAGTIAGDSATVQEITLGAPVALAPGWYWSAWAVQSAASSVPTMRVGVGAAFAVQVGTSAPSAGQFVAGLTSSSSVSGALPASFGSTFASSLTTRIFIKL